jgi:hypothetical protein
VKLLGREFVIEEVNDIGKEIFQNVTTTQNGHTESTMDDIFSLNCGTYEIEGQQKHSEHATNTSKTIETRVRSRHVRTVTPLY